MSKTQELATAFLQKTRLTRPAAPPISGVVNAFNSLFDVQELNDRESQSVERILLEGVEPGQLAEGEVGQDVLEVKRLTKELMAIKRQELILIGERIAQARSIFQKYKDRSFREWMNLTFGSYKTGYNYLSFYDLYTLVPDEIKDRLKEMPAKAAYVLASKKVPVEQKIAIVKEHSQNTAQNLISLIQGTLGSRYVPRRPRLTNEKLLHSLERDAAMILPGHLDEVQKQRIMKLIERLSLIVDIPKEPEKSDF